MSPLFNPTKILSYPNYIDYILKSVGSKLYSLESDSF